MLPHTVLFWPLLPFLDAKLSLYSCKKLSTTGETLELTGNVSSRGLVVLLRVTSSSVLHHYRSPAQKRLKCVCDSGTVTEARRRQRPKIKGT